MERVLLVRLSALGDVVHVLPALGALRAAFPQAKIGFAVEEKAASLLEGHPQIDRLHVVPRGALEKAARERAPARFLLEATRALRALRAERYQVALDFQSNFRSSLVARLSGARRCIGQPRPYAKEGSRLLLGEAPEPVAREVHKIERNLRLLAPLGIPCDEAPRPVVREPASSRSLAEEWVGSIGRPVVLLHPGVSAFGAFKAWREEGYAALARALPGVHVAVGWGGAGERAAAERIAAVSRGAAVLAPPTRSILDLAAILRRVAVVVGSDTGPVHLAAGLGTPTVGLYGPKDPRTYGPYWPNARVVRKGVPCSPCRLRRCARPECMSLITADEVAAAVTELLAARASPVRTGSRG